jgi:hypothetical protein
MKWFKHLVDSGDDPDIDDAISVFGPDGYYVFFRTLEVMSREFDSKKPGRKTFSVNYFKKKFRISWRKVRTILTFYQEKKRIFFKLFSDGRLDQIELNCPKLKELADEYTRKQIATLSGHAPDSTPEKVHLELETEVDVKNNDTGQARAAPSEPDPKAENPAKLFYLKPTPETAEIVALCEAIAALDQSKKFNVFQWVQFWTNKNAHPCAIVKALTSLKKAWPVRTGKPWAYVDATIRTINGNFNERDAIERAAQFKHDIALDKRFQQLLRGIGEP